MDLNTLKERAPWVWPADAGETLIGIITSRSVCPWLNKVFGS